MKAVSKPRHADVQGQVILGRGGCAAHRRVVSSIPGLTYEMPIAPPTTRRLQTSPNVPEVTSCSKGTTSVVANEKPRHPHCIPLLC